MKADSSLVIRNRVITSICNTGGHLSLENSVNTNNSEQETSSLVYDQADTVKV